MTSQRIVQGPCTATLADVLDRVLDKGLVVAGDIKIKLLDVELLTIQVRLVVCSVEKATEMGMDFWKPPPALPAGGAEELARRVAELEAVVAKREGGEPSR
ncbi:MAG TPA: gas vesicle protein [Archangium sp.]|uniref:gas vesicle protein n=1 Tax=Archangium sp. TaxID=1872627 RepID=UPI002E2F45A1|nr:gas vesicle protein [Archangium sp.]HEX5754687.1 gas vesicle protein [Archangium sp.]